MGRTIRAEGGENLAPLIEAAHAQSLLDYVKSCGIKLKKQGVKQPEYWGLCPFHDEDTPSFAVNAEKGVFHCHGCGAGGGVIDFVMQKEGRAFVDAVRFLAGNDHAAAKSPELGPIVATYVYSPTQRVTRHDPKAFRPWHRAHEQAPWQLGEGQVKFPLYHQDEVEAADPDVWVLIPEGEKDVDNLRMLGHLATTNAGGADRWREEFAEQFRGRRVMLLADNDLAGGRRIAKIGRALTGVAAEVRVLRFPDLPKGGDISDKIAQGWTRADIDQAIAAAPLWTPARGSAGASLRGHEVRPSQDHGLSKVTAKETAWLWGRGCAGEVPSPRRSCRRRQEHTRSQDRGIGSEGGTGRIGRQRPSSERYLYSVKTRSTTPARPG